MTRPLAAYIAALSMTTITVCGILTLGVAGSPSMIEFESRFEHDPLKIDGSVGRWESHQSKATRKTGRVQGASLDGGDAEYQIVRPLRALESTQGPQRREPAFRTERPYSTPDPLPPPRGSGTARLRHLAAVAANLCDVPPALFRNLIFKESSWNPRAVSKSGAVGLGQLMPRTARWMGLKVNGRTDDRLDPWQNLFASACYLSYVKGSGTWRDALLAYHGGKWRKATSQASLDYASQILEGME